jgi:hypothetical protein
MNHILYFSLIFLILKHMYRAKSIRLPSYLAKRTIYFRSDSQAAITALKSSRITSKLTEM